MGDDDSPTDVPDVVEAINRWTKYAARKLRSAGPDLFGDEQDVLQEGMIAAWKVHLEFKPDGELTHTQHMSATVMFKCLDRLRELGADLDPRSLQAAAGLREAARQGREPSPEVLAGLVEGLDVAGAEEGLRLLDAHTRVTRPDALTDSDAGGLTAPPIVDLETETEKSPGRDWVNGHRLSAALVEATLGPKRSPLRVLALLNIYLDNWGNGAGSRTLVRMTTSQGWSLDDVYEASQQVLEEIRPALARDVLHRPGLGAPSPPPSRDGSA